MSFLKIKNWLKYKKNCFHTMLLRYDFGAIGKGSIVHSPFHSNNAENVYIGEKCTVIGGGWIDTFDAKYDPRIDIGDGTY